MTEYQWKVGDKVKMNSKATSKYTITQEGAIGTIVRIYSNTAAAILFTKKENQHNPEICHQISRLYPSTLAAEFGIDLAYCSPFNNHVDDFSQILAKKIKTLDTKWATTQIKKGNKYALLLLQ